MPDLLRRVPLFSALSVEDIAPIAREARVLTVKRGTVVCHKGDRPQGFWCLLSGQVKLALLSPSGFEKVVDLIHPAMTFGEALVFVDQPCPVYAQALLDSTLVFVPQGPVLDALQRSPEFSRSMLAGISRRLHQIIQDLESQCLQPAAQRVIGYLLREVEAQRETVVTRSARIHLPVSKVIVAARLNVTPETLSRTLNFLSQQQLISVKGRFIHIRDLDALRSCGGS
jgi:CRP/FNR family transcriptional regulator, dissimilatory nitrate respiration regulator